MTNRSGKPTVDRKTSQELKDMIHDGQSEKAVTMIEQTPSDKLFSPSLLTRASHAAMTSNQDNIVMAFIKKFSAEELFSTNHEGKALLHYAIEAGKKEICNELIAKNGITRTQLVVRDKDGKSAFDMAKENGMPDLAIKIDNKLVALKLSERSQQTAPSVRMGNIREDVRDMLYRGVLFR